MPNLHQRGRKEKEPPLGKQPQSGYYVELLGWMECRGIRGQRYTEPVIRELRRRQKKMGEPPKLTIQVSRKELKISQEVDDRKKNGIKKIKFPTIPGRDVTFVHQASRSGDGRPDDTVACIYLGFMPRTGRFVHVYVYRFDGASTASDFTAQMSAIVNGNTEHILKVEQRLASRGEIDPPQADSADTIIEPQTTDSAVGSASSGYSDEDESPSFTPKAIEPDLESLAAVTPYDNVTDEFLHKIKLKESPILLPPIDYDTINRKHGNLIQVDLRRCNEEKIVGYLTVKERNSSNESGVDLASPAGENPTGSSRNKIPDAPAFLPNATKKQMIPPPPPPLPKPGVAGGDVSAPAETHSSSGSSSSSNNSNNPNQGDHRRQLPLGGGAPVPPVEAMYPPKKTSPPMSPRLYRQALGNAHQLHRQNSTPSDLGGEIQHKRQNSTGSDPARHALPRPNSSSENLGQLLQRQSSNTSDHLGQAQGHAYQRQGSNGSDGAGPGQPPFHRQNSNTSNGSFRLSQHADSDRAPEENKIRYYKGGNSDDLYAMPMKGPLASPPISPEVPPADYDDVDDEVQLRTGSRQQYRTSHLTRSLPAELIKSEMILGSAGSRPGCGEFRQIRRTDSPHHMRRTDSPAFVGGGRTESPVVFGARVDSPSFIAGPQGYAMGGHHRVDSPTLMLGSQPVIAGEGGGFSPRLMRVNSGKR